MHTTVFYIAIVWLAILLAVHVVEAVRDPHVLGRVLRMDVASIVLIAALLLVALHDGEPYYLDAALTLGLLSFVGTVVAARFLEGGGLFP